MIGWWCCDVVNELAKRALAESEGKEVKDLSFGSAMMAGATAGLCYWVGTYPLDVVKVSNTVVL